MTTIVKFRYHQTDGYRCLTSGDMSGEYVPLAEYQALAVQYRELGDSSNDAIQSLVKQRSQLQALIQRVNELGLNIFDLVWFDDYQTDTSPKLKQLLADCQEVLND